MKRSFASLSPAALASLARLAPSALGLAAALALGSCGPSMEPGGVMTPEQRLQEEERKAWEQEKAEKARGDQYAEPAETDDREAFDKKQAELEMKRASLSAQTCNKVVEGSKPTQIADISVTFGSDGKVRDASIGAPYSDTPLGECVLNAYRAVIVPPFREQDFTLAWQLDFNAPPPKAAEEEGAADDKGAGDGKKDAKKKDEKKKK